MLFEAGEFKQLAVSPANANFSWPEASAFEDTHLASAQAKPISLMRGDVIKVYGEGFDKQLNYTSWQHFEQSLADLRAKGFVDTDRCSDTHYAFFKEGELWDGVSTNRESCYLSLSNLQRLPVAENELVVVKAGRSVTVFNPKKIWASGNINHELWDAWTYSTTLMQLDKPLYITPEPAVLATQQAEQRKY